jgi:chaperone required for assembly of F1-ATPase
MAWTAKRFYRAAEVIAVDGGFAVTLDGRPARTWAGVPMVLPTAALARAIAEEFLAQEATIRPDTMPQLQLAATAIDRVGPRREAIIEQLVAYARSDLLCYRAAEPAELVARQEGAWQPLLEWVADTWGAELAVTRGVMPVVQPPGAVEALRAAVVDLDPVELTALAALVPASGSLVVGLAVVAGRISAEEAFGVAQVEETYQMERWGEIAEAAERRRRLRADILAAAAFLALARQDAGGLEVASAAG